MTKQEQIELINKLISDPDNYFVDQFGTDGLQKMCENIKNDFTLLCGVKVADHKQLSERNIKAIKNCLATKINELIQIIENAEKDPEFDSAELDMLKIECTDLIFASNKFKN